MLNAEQALGKDEPDSDWELHPEGHADYLPPEADGLTEILTGSAVKSIIQRYEEADKNAIMAQTEYKTYGRAAIIAAAIAAPAGAILIYFSKGSNIESTNGTSTFSALEVFLRYNDQIRFILFFFQAIALSLAAYFTYLLREREPFKRWMNQRALAEMKRLEYFENVCGPQSINKEEPQPEEGLELPSLQLEYFRRYQLEVQLRYYCGRSKQHEEASRRQLTLSASFVFLSTFIVAFGAYLGDIAQGLEFLALLGVALTVIMSAQGNLKLLSQHQRNAIRYANTCEKLRIWGGQLDDIRKKVSAGQREALDEFVKCVNHEISLEHKEWVTLQDESAKPNLESEV